MDLLLLNGKAEPRYGHEGTRIPERGKGARGGREVEIQPMSQERRHGGASREGPLSPDSCGIHSLIGVIDTALLLCDFSVGLPKKGVYGSYSPAISKEKHVVAKERAPVQANRRRRGIMTVRSSIGFYTLTCSNFNRHSFPSKKPLDFVQS